MKKLKRRLIVQSELRTIFKKDILEIFVDWNFEADKGYMVLLLEAKK